ncbi:MAG: aconitase/3-isopropylmalate dehydratase large subunit family protein [bacterium]
MTITEKILAQHAGKSQVSPGDKIWIEVDLLLTHDVCGPGTISIFKNEFGPESKVWDKEKIVIIPDHYIFTQDTHAKRNIEVLREFARQQHITHFYDVDSPRYKGVCHVALAEEKFTRPGQVLLGTDSHTCTSGAFGMFATGIGNTDAAFVMGTGRLWVRVPETLKYIINDTIPDYVMAKDVILHIIKDIGIAGATYKAMEFSGEAIRNMSREERMTLCNMVVEAGAKNGIIAPDKVTSDYFSPDTEEFSEWQYEGDDEEYAGITEYSGTLFEPLVAEPYCPDNVTPAHQLNHIKLDQAYIGSCTGGKITDFLAAAKILKDKKVVIKTKGVPATMMVKETIEEQKLDGKSVYQILEEAGVEMGPPSCAACLGGPEDTFGRLQGKEVCISTTNRNFPGRMGSPDSKTYLASPLTVAASALTGKITDPREYL